MAGGHPPPPYYRPYVVASCLPATSDSVRLVLRPDGGGNGNTTHLRVRPGHHVQFRRTVPLQEAGSDSESSFELLRSYTPVPQLLFAAARDPDQKDHQTTDDGRLYFFIKIYPTGALTPILGLLTPGDRIDIGDPAGDYSPSPIIGDTAIADVVVYMLAAGTGITPMLSILPSLGQDISVAVDAGRRRRVVLLYFNRTERGIIARGELARFAAENSWLEIVDVLSDEPTWSDGPRGRVCSELLAGYVEPTVGNIFVAYGR